MIEEILPAGVVVAEAFDDRTTGPLHPQEEASIRQAVAARRREFTTGRLCARQALGRLGREGCAVPVGPSGEPLWPAGTTGSITHCAGYRGAAVARVADVLALGIDAEPDLPLPDGVLDAVASPAERAALHRLRRLAGDAVSWDRLLFSAKESVYKAWFPAGGRLLDFLDAHVALDAAGTFSARLLLTPHETGRGLPSLHRGRWTARGGLLLTAVTRPAPRTPRPDRTGPEARYACAEPESAGTAS